MSKYVLAVNAMFFIFTVSSHELPHQSQLSSSSCPHDSSMQIHTLQLEEIEYWYGDTNSYSILGKDFDLPESYISYDEAIEQMSFDQYGNIIPELSEIDCSIYIGEDSELQRLCGEVDHFLRAAHAAINYCQDNFGQHPYFIGPQNFLDAINEDTLGEHHNTYDTSETIWFSCISYCDLVER